MLLLYYYKYDMKHKDYICGQCGPLSFLPPPPFLPYPYFSPLSPSPTPWWICLGPRHSSSLHTDSHFAFHQVLGKRGLGSPKVSVQGRGRLSSFSNPTVSLTKLVPNFDSHLSPCVYSQLLSRRVII